MSITSMTFQNIFTGVRTTISMPSERRLTDAALYSPKEGRWYLVAQYKTRCGWRYDWDDRSAVSWRTKKEAMAAKRAGSYERTTAGKVA